MTSEGAPAAVSSLTLSIDSLKYLNNLPNFDGNRDNLHNFIDLVDRIYPTLGRYDEIRPMLFFDIFKNKLVSKAGEAIKINNSVSNWEDVKKLFL